MKRPSFQFYPADWQGNSNLRRCTHEEKGIWADVMCLMHDQEEYGIIRWSLKEIAQAVNATPAKLVSLIGKGVLKGADAGERCRPFIYTPRSSRQDGLPVTLIAEQAGPVWYSSRMVRDEYVRTIRGESSRFGEDKGAAPKHTPKQSPNITPKPPLGDEKGDGPSSSSSSPSSSGKEKDVSKETSQKKPSRSQHDYTAEFESFWLVYPKNGASKAESFKSYQRALREGATDATIENGCRAYAEYIRRTGTSPEHTAHATTWLNNQRWTVDYAGLVAEWEKRTADNSASGYRKESAHDVAGKAWATVAERNTRPDGED